MRVCLKILSATLFIFRFLSVGSLGVALFAHGLFPERYLEGMEHDLEFRVAEIALRYQDYVSRAL